MSDLSNTQVEKEVDFNSQEYFKVLCAGTKISLSEFANVQFLEGWKSLVGYFVNEIKGYSIEIKSISDTYMLLDVDFDVKNRTREVNVWRAIQHARQQSKTTCANCGEYKRGDKSGVGPTIFCIRCDKKSATKLRTGTWLDKY